MKESIYTIRNQMDMFEKIDMASVGMRDIIKGLDPLKGIQSIEIDLSECGVMPLVFMERRPVYKLLLEPEKMRFGGCRWWFFCPCCKKLRRTLFVSPPEVPTRRIACRLCHGIKYGSKGKR